MARTTEPASETLHLNVRVNPANVDLVPDNPEYEARKAAVLPLREQRYLESLQVKAAAGELDFLPGGATPDPEAIAEEAGRLARRDFEIVCTLGGWGLAARDNMGLVYWGGVEIDFTMDDSLPLGDFEIDGDHGFDEAFHKMQVLAPL